MNSKIRLLAFAMVLTVSDVTATGSGEICFVPMRGQGLSTCVPEFDRAGNVINPCGETLGNYSMLLRKIGFGPGALLLKIDGPFRGLSNPDQTFNHVLGDMDGRGLLYTLNDYLETAVQVDDCLLDVKEVLNIDFGVGDYAGAHGTLVVAGTLDQCSGVNDFKVVVKESELCFSATASTLDFD